MTTNLTLNTDFHQIMRKENQDRKIEKSQLNANTNQVFLCFIEDVYHLVISGSSGFRVLSRQYHIQDTSGITSH